ncbi:MAG: hypothetical protein ABF430_12825 [Acetobacter persici]
MQADLPKLHIALIDLLVFANDFGAAGRIVIGRPGQIRTSAGFDHVEQIERGEILFQRDKQLPGESWRNKVATTGASAYVILEAVLIGLNTLHSEHPVFPVQHINATPQPRDKHALLLFLLAFLLIRADATCSARPQCLQPAFWRHCPPAQCG